MNTKIIKSDVERQIETVVNHIESVDPNLYNGSLYDIILEEIDMIIEAFELNYCFTSDVDDLINHLPKYVTILEYMREHGFSNYHVQGDNIGVQLNTIVRNNLHIAIKHRISEECVQEWCDVMREYKAA